MVSVGTGNPGMASHATDGVSGPIEVLFGSLQRRGRIRPKPSLQQLRNCTAALVTEHPPSSPPHRTDMNTTSTFPRPRVFGPAWPAEIPTDPSLFPEDLSGRITTIALLGAQSSGQLPQSVLSMRAVSRGWFDEVRSYFQFQSPMALAFEAGHHAYLCLTSRTENPLGRVAAHKKCALWFRSLHLEGCPEKEVAQLLGAPGWKRAALGKARPDQFMHLDFSSLAAEPDQVFAARFVIIKPQDLRALAQVLPKLPYRLELELDIRSTIWNVSSSYEKPLIELVAVMATCPNGAMVSLGRLAPGMGSNLLRAFLGRAQLRLPSSTPKGGGAVNVATFQELVNAPEQFMGNPRLMASWERGEFEIPGHPSPAGTPSPVELVFPRPAGDVVFTLQLTTTEQADLLLNCARYTKELAGAANALDLTGVSAIVSKPDSRTQSRLLRMLEQATYLHTVDINLARMNEPFTDKLIALLQKQPHLLDCRLAKGRLRPWQAGQLASLVKGQEKKKPLLCLDLSNTVIEGGAGLAEAMCKSSLTTLRINARYVSGSFMEALTEGLGANWKLDELDLGWIAPGQLLKLVAMAPHESFKGRDAAHRRITFRVPGDGLRLRVLVLADMDFRELAKTTMCHAYKVSPHALDAFLSDEGNLNRFPSPSPDYDTNRYIGATVGLVPDETRQPEDSSDSEVSEDGLHS